MLTEQEKSEYQTLTQEVGWRVLQELSFFEVSGADATSFLQGMVSNDVQRLKGGEGCYATCLTSTGKMLSDVTIYKLEDRFWLSLLQENQKKILDHLDHYLFTEDVSLKAIEKKTLVSVQGPASRKMLTQHLKNPLPEIPHAHGVFPWGEMSLKVFQESRVGSEGFDCLLSEEDTPSFISKFSIPEVGERAFETVRIESGIPRYPVDMNEETIPLEVGLEHAISYEKGCYIGQEVIARIKYLGHTNRTLMGLLLSEPAHEGETLFLEGKAVGRITSSTFSPKRSTYIALALIRREQAKEGVQLLLEHSKGKQTATVCPLPF